MRVSNLNRSIGMVAPRCSLQVRTATRSMRVAAQSRANVNMAKKGGLTPLCVAARDGYKEICELLLAQGAKVDQATWNGKTPLFFAKKNGHADIIKILMNKVVATLQPKHNQYGCISVFQAAIMLQKKMEQKKEKREACGSSKPDAKRPRR